MNYYEIALSKYTGASSDIFTYSHNEDMLPGTVVIVNLKNKELVGVVIKKCGKPKFKTREIKKTLFEGSAINLALLNTGFWISKYYGAPISSVIQTILPPGVSKKRRQLQPAETTGSEIRSCKQIPTIDQKNIIDSITRNLKGKPHLIFGATASGKTEIYLHLIEKVLKEGKQAIVLVPEISLTPQAIERYTARFGNNVAVLHSHLKETERFSNWKSILDNKKQIVIGSRSAVFAPCNNLGIIIIDEAHENSYKQDQTPKYNAIKVAEKITNLCDAALILGTATPTIEQFYKAEKGEYHLHQLNKRIVQENMPKVEIVNMADEFKKRNFSIFSEKLKESITETLSKNQQVILFINRRGMATFVSCRECGYVEKCPNCDIPLTFHLNQNKLRCHYCNFTKNVATSCPICKSFAIKYFGGGTQKVETEVNRLFGKEYKIARMDTDTAKSNNSYIETYNLFVQGEIDILIGTQIISKGWDVPNVGLVGIVSADTLLNFPDIFSSERTYSLLTQVSGRTGRGKAEGRVIIQTYSPDNPAIEAAAKNNFLDFYENEIAERKELNYPPFARLIKLLYNNPDENIAETNSLKIANQIKAALDEMKVKYSLKGPSPSFIPKIAGCYRWQILLKINTNDDKIVINIMAVIQKITNKEWPIDVDPISLI